MENVKCLTNDKLVDSIIYFLYYRFVIVIISLIVIIGMPSGIWTMGYFIAMDDSTPPDGKIIITWCCGTLLGLMFSMVPIGILMMTDTLLYWERSINNWYENL